MKVLQRRVLPAQKNEVQKQVQQMQKRIAAGDALNLGDKGAAVIALQKHLKAAGLYTGKVTGTFDEATEAAVKAFQAAKGLEASGIAGGKTFKALKAVNVYVKDGFKTAAKEGQRGSDILRAEKALEKLGFRPGKVDGVFDAKTQAALQRFRKSDKNVADKGKAIGERLYGELRKDAKAMDHAAWRRRDVVKNVKPHKRLDDATAKAAAKGDGVAIGAKGRAVANIEKHLEAAGYDVGARDAKFTSRTEAAVKAFQRASGMPETGVVDAKTWGRLRGVLFAATGATSPAQRLGERGGAVKSVENKLRKLGFNIKADGVFDKSTERAVERFQKKHKLKVTGHVGGGTLAKINKVIEQRSGPAYLEKVVKLARTQLGVREVGGSSNIQKYSKFFGRPPEPWCADFVSWLYTKSGKKLNDPYTPSLLGKLRANGTAHRGVPKPGEIVIFDWNPNAGVPAEHTGIVEKVFKKGGRTYVQTIEGNSGGMVRRRTYPLNDPTIRAFGWIK